MIIRLNKITKIFINPLSNYIKYSMKTETNESLFERFIFSTVISLVEHILYEIFLIVVQYINTRTLVLEYYTDQ